MLTVTLLNLLFFIVLTLLIIFLPGFLLLSKVQQDLDSSEIISLSFSLGIVLFVGLGIILGLTHLRFMLLPVLLTTGFFSAVKFKKQLLFPWKIFAKDKLLTLIILIGIFVQGFISFPSGYKYQEGLLFWSSQGFDGFWHVSLMEEIKKQFPPQMPTYAGESLVNYHYLSDILMGEYGRVFPFFSSLDLYFRFFPIIFSFLMGINIFAFVKKWQNIKVAYWALFFTYFTGSFGYIVTWFRNGQIFGGETVFWVSQLNTVVANPPHAVAISLLSALLLSLLFFLKKKGKMWFFITVLCGLFIAGFKVSSGPVLLVGLAVIAVGRLLIYKDISTPLLLGILSLSNFVTIKLMTKGVEGYLIFSPWWFIRTMVVDKLGWMDMELRRQHYLSKNTWHAWLRVLQLESFAFIVFLIGNIGMRFIGILEIFKKTFLKKYWFYNQPFEIGIFVMMLTAFIIPLFFLQKGIVYNTVQFMQYFLLFFGFYAAITVTKLIKFIKVPLLKFLFIAIIIIFSVPTVIGNLVEFYGPDRTPLALISNEELTALQYLKINSNEDSIILSPPFDKYLKDKFKTQPMPIYAWYSTGYISGITSRRTYLALDDMVIQTGLDFDGRLAKVKIFFEQKDAFWDRSFLTKAGIDYIYIPKDQLKIPLDLIKNNLDLIFENSKVLIYKVK